MASKIKKSTPNGVLLNSMRPDFDPANLSSPVRTVDLGLKGKPFQLAISPTGLIAITGTKEDSKSVCLYIFDNQYNIINSCLVTEGDMLEVSIPMQICFDSTDGTVVMAFANILECDSDDEEGRFSLDDTSGNKIGLYKYNLNGKPLPIPNLGGKLKGADNVKLATTTGVTCNGQGDVFFLLAYGDNAPIQAICKVEKRSEEFSLFHQWDFPGDGYDSDSSADFELHFQLCFGPNGNMYCGYPRGIEVYNEKGNHINTIQGDYLDCSDSSLENSISLTASGDGKLFLTQASTALTILSLDGTVLGECKAPDNGVFSSVAIDHSGYLHVLDMSNGKVLIY